MTRAWTREKPTKPGWYWWRQTKRHYGEIVCVIDIDILTVNRNGVITEVRGGEWAGPIPEPIEARAREGCQHMWGTDGAHNNEYCKKCFVSKEAS